ncbi:hypothetical protein DNI05_08590 [Salmonella enterica subsp. enterica serovar Newport]|nr:hypothetical protein [Salmonella enterica subsp. enterica serovar Newport]
MKKTKFKNLLPRTEAISSLEVGDSILLAPYNDGEYAREQDKVKNLLGIFLVVTSYLALTQYRKHFVFYLLLY